MNTHLIPLPFNNQDWGESVFKELQTVLGNLDYLAENYQHTGYGFQIETDAPASLTFRLADMIAIEHRKLLNLMAKGAA